MGAGGIINQRAAALLISITEPCLYDSLTPETKAIVDAIDAKEPTSRTEDDVRALAAAIQEVVNC